MTPNLDDELSRAGLPARRLSVPEPVAKRRRFWITGRFAGVDGSSFAVNVEAADETEAKAEALRLLSGATPIIERAGARVDHGSDPDLPPVETIIDGQLQPER